MVCYWENFLVSQISKVTGGLNFIGFNRCITLNIENVGNWHFEEDGYTLRGGYSVEVVFVSLLKRGLFLKEIIWDSSCLYLFRKSLMCRKANRKSTLQKKKKRCIPKCRVLERNVSFMFNIMKTCLYNFDPLKPHFNIGKLGYILFSYFCSKT